MGRTQKTEELTLSKIMVISKAYWAQFFEQSRLKTREDKKLIELLLRRTLEELKKREESDMGQIDNFYARK
jgi:hypothetical protein